MLKLHEIDDQKEAAKALLNFLKGYAKENGMNPDTEVSYAGYDGTPEWPCVCFEAGPYQWGVALSLGGKPIPGLEYDPSKQANWFLEPYYSFDVCFTQA